ncbi:MAG: hypothetical protein K9K39_04975 [Desulfohalobiaceae bacterium]|nr:hypothetical protein [Desulfohalobiaceae bacterium]
MDQEERKRAIYESLSPRRRKFIDRIGFEEWDPFQEPKHPFDIRKDRTSRTASQIVEAFYREMDCEAASMAYRNGVQEMCMGIFNWDERYRGMYEFCRWYMEELRRMGHDPLSVWKR